jgi:hypothetical protein
VPCSAGPIPTAAPIDDVLPILLTVFPKQIGRHDRTTKIGLTNCFIITGATGIYIGITTVSMGPSPSTSQNIGEIRLCDLQDVGDLIPGLLYEFLIVQKLVHTSYESAWYRVFT